jgi:hypothetical protein
MDIELGEAVTGAAAARAGDAAVSSSARPTMPWWQRRSTRRRRRVVRAACSDSFALSFCADTVPQAPDVAGAPQQDAPAMAAADPATSSGESASPTRCMRVLKLLLLLMLLLAAGAGAGVAYKLGAPRAMAGARPSALISQPRAWRELRCVARSTARVSPRSAHRSCSRAPLVLLCHASCASHCRARAAVPCLKR